MSKPNGSVGALVKGGSWTPERRRRFYATLKAKEKAKQHARAILERPGITFTEANPVVKAVLTVRGQVITVEFPERLLSSLVAL